MRRLSALRSPYFLLVLLVVISVQISINLLVSQCHQVHQFTREENAVYARKTTVDTKNIMIKLHDTEEALRAFKAKLELDQERSNNTTELLRKKNKDLASQLEQFKKLKKIMNAQEFSKIKNGIIKKDFLKGDTVHSEIEVVAFDSFTATGIYTRSREVLHDRPFIRPLGTRAKEHHEVLRFSLNILNDDLSNSEKLTYNNFDNGITRLDRLNGMHYNMFFAGSKPHEYYRVKVRRPFSNLEVVDSVETVDTSNETINLIIPLSGRTKRFQEFLKHFADVCVRWDKNVYLTVVYFGVEGRDSAKAVLQDFAKKENFANFNFIFEKGPFSRGAGLQKGVLSWNKGNNIMFFCDVDVYFTPGFLERCRLYTEPEKMVYYPIVFSLYNPEVVYNGAPPKLEKQLYIGKENGFWRDYGFGMTCQYKNDFISTKGFDTSIHGWGTEDVKLYRKFLRTDLTVIRATDRGIFHLYHQKYCDPVLSSDQYLACLKSKAVNEGSQRQMGMLAFGTQLFSNIQPKWKSKLLYKPNFSTRKPNQKTEELRNIYQKADELDSEVLEIQLLRERLETVLNFTVFDMDNPTFKKSDLRLLNELESNISKQADFLKLFAKMIEKKQNRNSSQPANDL